MAGSFKKATKSQARLRMAPVGPSGSGKTWTSLLVAREIAAGGRIALLYSERGSASKYADHFDFDVLELRSFSPQNYVDHIDLAAKEGYAVLVIDSLSHAWMGKDGALEQVDKAAARSQSRNSFAAWREVTPVHNRLVDAILGAPLHVLVTMRAKTEYVLEEDEKGRKALRKIGLAPVQRDGLEYEFDIVADMDLSNTLVVSKTRMPSLRGAIVKEPGADFAQEIAGWLTTGAALPAQPSPSSEQLRKNLRESVFAWSGLADQTDRRAALVSVFQKVGVPFPAQGGETSDEDLTRLIAWVADQREKGVEFVAAVSKPKDEVQAPPSKPKAVAADGGLPFKPWPRPTKPKENQVQFYRLQLLQKAGKWKQGLTRDDHFNTTPEQLVTAFEREDKLPVPGEMSEPEAAVRYKAALESEKPIDWSKYVIPF